MMATSNYIVAIFLVVLSLTQYSSTKRCLNAIPGVAKLTVGVDITKLDLLPLKGFSIGGFKNPIIQLTCNRGRKRKSPSGLEYDMPDQVWRIYTLPGGSKPASVNVLRSYHQVKKKMALEAGMSAGYDQFAFSASASYAKMQDTITNTNKEIIDVRSQESSYKTTLYPPKRKEFIDPIFQKYIENNLKGKPFKSNKEVFKKFIGMFGTHYVKWGEYGGIIRKYMETSKRYSSTKTDEQLSAQAQASYKGLVASLSRSAKFDKGETNVDKSFKSATKESVTYYGGEANLVDSNGLKYWQPTVDKDPMLFKIRTGIIYDIIKDASLKSELKIAIDDYVMRSFSKEINRKVTNAIRKWSDPVLKELLLKVQTLQKVDILGRKEVLDMDSKVEHQITIPNWFMKDTAICYKYKSMLDGDHYQCNEEANDKENKTFCATPNSYTKRYHDNTGKMKEGCLMHWGIVSYNAPKWFKETQIQFKGVITYYGMFAELVQRAASVNSFTYKYEDSTVFGYHGNILSWRITLPNQAPVWLRNSKLCFEWEPYDKKNGAHQCQADNRKLCAKPGAYTANYTDITDVYNVGGCYMKWGWYLIGN